MHQQVQASIFATKHFLVDDAKLCSLTCFTCWHNHVFSGPQKELTEAQSVVKCARISQIYKYMCAFV